MDFDLGWSYPNVMLGYVCTEMNMSRYDKCSITLTTLQWTYPYNSVLQFSTCVDIITYGEFHH